ncbi:MAG: exodeoxyribonuclease VII small subunit [Firmicutes bacterium]|nr:exodeoxyribonuclease VII small subunit [Bacillota bacterium]
MEAKEKLKFEDALRRLEEIVHTLEQGDADLEAALTLFEEGSNLIKVCDQELKTAEQKLEKLAGNDE